MSIDPAIVLTDWLITCGIDGQKAEFYERKVSRRNTRNTKRRTAACAGGYENRGAISRTTTSTSGHRKGPRFTAVSDPLNRQEPACGGAVEGSSVREEKKKKRNERGRERGGLAALNGSAKLTMIYGVGVPNTILLTSHYSIDKLHTEARAYGPGSTLFILPVTNDPAQLPRTRAWQAGIRYCYLKQDYPALKKH